MTRVPLARRCPHGNDQHVCCTCVEATKAAEDYVHRTRAALAAQPTPAAVPLTDEQIKDALLQYRCAHFQDEDGGLPLTDALAHAFGDTDITRAKHEIEMIVDAIAAAAAAGDKT